MKDFDNFSKKTKQNFYDEKKFSKYGTDSYNLVNSEDSKDLENNGIYLVFYEDDFKGLDMTMKDFVYEVLIPNDYHDNKFYNDGSLEVYLKSEKDLDDFMKLLFDIGFSKEKVEEIFDL